MVGEVLSQEPPETKDIAKLNKVLQMTVAQGMIDRAVPVI